jgi:uncharacterized protein YuzE
MIKMTIKFNYDDEDDIFTIYNDEYPPVETIEFSDMLNIDIDSKKSVVGIEVFNASEFFSAINQVITEDFLKSIDNALVECKNYRNNWLIFLIFERQGKKERLQMPPLRKNDYTSPLIASCN